MTRRWRDKDRVGEGMKLVETNPKAIENWEA
jgi:hypothetical protein